MYSCYVADHKQDYFVSLWGRTHCSSLRWILEEQQLLEVQCWLFCTSAATEC